MIGIQEVRRKATGGTVIVSSVQKGHTAHVARPPPGMAVYKFSFSQSSLEIRTQWQHTLQQFRSPQPLLNVCVVFTSAS
jgi:hypothetical protein